MKITMDKDYTLPKQAERVKADMKEFKSRYTDGDLRSAFQDMTNFPCCGDIIRTTVTAFSSTWSDFADTTFRVEMVTEDVIGFERFSFYCDLELNISEDELLLNYARFGQR